MRESKIKNGCQETSLRNKSEYINIYFYTYNTICSKLYFVSRFMANKIPELPERFGRG